MKINDLLKAASACGSIWILGGETSEVFKYRPSTDEWSQMAITLPNHVHIFVLQGFESRVMAEKPLPGALGGAGGAPGARRYVEFSNRRAPGLVTRDSAPRCPLFFNQLILRSITAK